MCCRLRRQRHIQWLVHNVFSTGLRSLPCLAGLSGSGKSTVACTLEHALAQRGHMTVLLDGDNVRHGLNHNLGFRCGWGGGS